MATDAATIFCGSAPSSAPSSPKQRLKFLCSHGGKILLRHTDGQLKYVGGETRVISVPRDIPFREVMKRLTYLIDGEMILKYQLLSEDLDALVSVKSDEDLVHMFDEIEHYEIARCPRMRAFLFPVNHHVVIENQMEPLPNEQRYIYSINGINTKQLSSLASSACSTSPRSPDSTAEAINTDSSIHKIQSSPSIPQQISSHYVQLHHPQYYHNSGRNAAVAAAAAAPERLVSLRSVGRGDGTTAPAQHYYATREINKGNGCCTKCLMHHDDSSHFSDRRIIDRQATLP